MKLKNRESLPPQTADLGPLINARTEHQRSSSIRRRDREGIVLFQGQKGRNPHVFPLNGLRGVIF